MTPIVYINTSSAPFIEKIIALEKVLETRDRDTLRPIINRPVYIAESGHGPAIVRCSAVFLAPLVVRSGAAWDDLRPWTCIEPGTLYDWTEKTRVKFLYPVQRVVKVPPFPVPEGKRHWTTWIECNEEKYQLKY
jgi:hypothetical protein